jgi:hypothetical protein
MMSGGGGGIWAWAHDAMAMSNVAVSFGVFMVCLRLLAVGK